MNTAVEAKRSYWFGVLPDCPFQNVSVGGITFHTFTEKVEHKDGKLMTQRTKRPGAVVELEAHVIEKVEKLLGRLKIRRLAERRAEVIDPEAKHRNPLMGYRPHAGDVPLADFLYFIPVEEAHEIAGVQWSDTYKPPCYTETSQAKTKRAKRE